MDIGKFDEMFQNVALKEVLWSARQEGKKIKENELVKNLLSIPDAQKEKYIQLFLDALSQMKARKIHRGTCGKLESRLQKKIAEFAPPLKATIEKIIAASGIGKSAASKQAPHKNILVSFPPGFQYDKFPDQLCLLHACKTRAEKLRAKKGEAEAILQEINRRVEFDPLLNCTSDAANKPPFALNKTGKNIKGISLNANDVRLGKKRNYLLSSCPKSIKEAGHLYDAALHQGVSLFVSTLEATEATDYMNNFWTKEKLTQISLRFGWKIDYIGNHLLAERAKEPKAERTPQLIETCLIAKKDGAPDRILTHIHYDAWRDHHAAPNEELLNILLERIEQIQEESTTAFQVNCKGGMGRTGTLVISHYIRQKINEELEKGVALDSIALNVPEIVYEFRKQRKGIVSHGQQLTQIYSVASTYYEQLKAKRAAS